MEALFQTGGMSKRPLEAKGQTLWGQVHHIFCVGQDPRGCTSESAQGHQVVYKIQRTIRPSSSVELVCGSGILSLLVDLVPLLGCHPQSARIDIPINPSPGQTITLVIIACSTH